MRVDQPSMFGAARSIEARFRVLGPDQLPHGAHQAARTSHLGTAGAFIASREPLLVGTRLFIELQLPSVGRSIQTTGEVRWIRDGEDDPMRGMGVRFDGFSDSDLVVLTDFLATQTGKFSAA